VRCLNCIVRQRSPCQPPAQLLGVCGECKRTNTPHCSFRDAPQLQLGKLEEIHRLSVASFARECFFESLLYLFIYFMFIDLSGPLQSLMAQHSSLLLQAQQMEFALSQYCRLLATFAWDFRLMRTQHGSDRLAQFGLANSAADIDAFADFLGRAGFSEDEASYSARLSVAQDSYSRILSFLQPLLPSLFNSGDSVPSLPVSEPGPSTGLPAAFSSNLPAEVGSSTESVPVVSNSVDPPVPVAAAASSSSAAVPAASSRVTRSSKRRGRK
jgi:hypothetical protein